MLHLPCHLPRLCSYIILTAYFNTLTLISTVFFKYLTNIISPIDALQPSVRWWWPNHGETSLVHVVLIASFSLHIFLKQEGKKDQGANLVCQDIDYKAKIKLKNCANSLQLSYSIG